jgi:integrase
LREWIDKITAPPARDETLGDLIQYRLDKEISKLSKSRRENFRWFVNFLNKKFPHLKEVAIREITPALIGDVLSEIKQRNGKSYKPRSFNEIAGQMKALMEIGIRNGIIVQNPFTLIPRNQKRKPVKDKPTVTPSFEQFWRIVEQIRKNRLTDHSEESADFVEFMGCAGLGAAEVRNIRWADIKSDTQKIAICRNKTDQYFEIPIYPELKPLLDRLKACAGESPFSRIFRIKTVPKKAIATSCRKLGYPNFTPRSLRKMRITDLIRKNVHYKTIANWQGHQDGGKLILNTYSNILSESNDSFESSQIAKLYDQHNRSENGQ